MTGCAGGGKTVSVLVRGSSGAVVAEAARSLHDALCAVRCVARRPALLPGGGAPEVGGRRRPLCPVSLCLTVSVLVRGSSGAVVAEAARSLHDALCAVRCVARRPALLPGGGAPEAAAAAALAKASITAPGADHYCLRAYSDALEVVPSTLAENAGLNSIETVTELRAAHAVAAGAGTGGCGAGVNVRRGRVTDMRQEHVLQPLHVTASALALATETVRAILKIDDIVNTMN
ncbi:TCP-1/cpn60 chaperonin family domain-containing protein [Phthorimaea operculella]|nr:TCP-1/cpn60 chaperonin family domain-containing protein [Phthorimaea operculella]